MSEPRVIFDDEDEGHRNDEKDGAEASAVEEDEEPAENQDQTLSLDQV